MLFTLALCLSVSGWSQDQVTIVGTVRDNSGAVIPGAKVTVTNMATGETRDLTSNSAGEYTAFKIPPGTYQIVVEATGFEKLMRTDLVADVGRTLRVDVELTVGRTTQEITITGSAAKVNTETGAVSSVITGTLVTELNLNGRNFTGLTMLVPGASASSAFDSTHMGFGSGQEQISFNGDRISDVNVEIDGGRNSDMGGGGRNVVTFPVIDSIQEFSITTSNYGADIGERGGANIQVVTKGGTKDFHGAAYEFVRNNDMDSNDWFLDRTLHPSGSSYVPNFNAAKETVKWNIFGYDIGGPVTIPGHYNTDKSKTFFYWSEGWARYREGGIYGSSSVFTANTPTLRMRAGDFSECDKTSANYNSTVASGCTVPKNPVTGTAFAGDIVPIDHNAAAIMNGLIPLPNNGTFGYIDAPDLPDNWRQENVRVDQNFGVNTSMFARFTQENHQYNSTFSTFDTAELHYGLVTKSSVFHLTHSFSSRLVNEFILSWENDWQHYNNQPGDKSPADNIHKPSTWTAGVFFPANRTAAGGISLPAVSVSGGTPFGFSQSTSLNGVNTYNPSGTLKDNMIFTVGKHNLKFGVYIVDAHACDYDGSITSPQGSFSFTGSGPLTTGNGLADMYLGRIASYGEGSPIVGGTAVGGWGLVRNRAKSLEPYFQDDWRVTRRLTLNLGLRWQYRYDWTEASKPSLASDFYPTQFNPADAAVLTSSGTITPGVGINYTEYGNGLDECGVNGVPVGCIDNYKRAFAPRFGFAYDPRGNGKTAIRGGFGIFYDMGYNNTPGAVSAAGNAPATLSPSESNILGYTAITSGTISPPGFGAWDPKERRPMLMNFNLTVEHEFRGNNVATLAYVGSLGRRLDGEKLINQVPPGSGTDHIAALAGTTGCDSSGNCNVQSILEANQHPVNFFRPYQGWGSIRWLNDTDTSDYNSLQATFRHTVGHGLTTWATYTWSHALDSQTTSTSSESTEYYTDLERWYGNSDNDRTQIVQLSYVYQLPFFRDNNNHFVRNGLGGWNLSGISSFFGGLPVDFGCSETGTQTGIGTGGRCNTIAAWKIDKNTTIDPRYGPTPTWFNPGAIEMLQQSQLPANGEPGMYGYMGRNMIHGPGRNDWDIALLKDFKLPGREGMKLQFRAETYNTFNHPQFKAIQAGCSGTTGFGNPCNNSANLGNGEVTTAWSPRQIQLGLKFMF
jgi:hypothetical protein